MILVDANVLIDAVNSDAPHHRRARRWFEDAVSGSTEVGLPWVVLLAFLRVTTRDGILARPLAPSAALAYVDEWLRLPNVEAVGPGPNHWPLLRNLLKATGTAGNLTSDAQMAAMAFEPGAPVQVDRQQLQAIPRGSAREPARRIPVVCRPRLPGWPIVIIPLSCIRRPSPF